jgi:hypothetical protein
VKPRTERRHAARRGEAGEEGVRDSEVMVKPVPRAPRS